MADFNTHISASTVAGIGMGTAGYLIFDLPETTCMIAAGLCSVAGTLPDLDSGSGRPFRETTAILAAIVPMLMIDRFQHLGMNAEAIALAGAITYIVVRFGVAELFRKYTVHRGMWHSIPAAFCCTLAAFLIVSGEVLDVRLFKAGAVFVGFMVHLILDEIWSVEWQGGTPKFKKSFGTAIKFWNPRSLWSNVSTYAKLIILIMAAVGDPLLMEHFGHHPKNEINQIATEQIQSIFR
ncbi:MAG: metal-dependent hydrolase [Pirellulaceae bacterium]